MKKIAQGVYLELCMRIERVVNARLNPLEATGMERARRIFKPSPDDPTNGELNPFVNDDPTYRKLRRFRPGGGRNSVLSGTASSL